MAPKPKSWFVRQKVLRANIHETEGLLERSIALYRVIYVFIQLYLAPVSIYTYLEVVLTCVCVLVHLCMCIYACACLCVCKHVCGVCVCVYVCVFVCMYLKSMCT